jgi:hypothetical protein
MKAKNLVLGLTVLIVSIFFAQAALAECKAGKTEVTIDPLKRYQWVRLTYSHHHGLLHPG